MLTAVIARNVDIDNWGYPTGRDIKLLVFDGNENLILSDDLGQDKYGITAQVSSDDKYVVANGYLYTVADGSKTYIGVTEGPTYTEAGNFVVGRTQSHYFHSSDYQIYNPNTGVSTSVQSYGFRGYLQASNLFYTWDRYTDKYKYFDADTLQEVEGFSDIFESTDPSTNHIYDTGVAGVAYLNGYLASVDGWEVPLQIIDFVNYFLNGPSGENYFIPSPGGGFFLASVANEYNDNSIASLDHYSLEGVFTRTNIQTALGDYGQPSNRLGACIFFNAGDFTFFAGGTKYFVQKSPIMRGVSPQDFALAGVPPSYTYDRSFWDGVFGPAAGEENQVELLVVTSSFPRRKMPKTYKPFWKGFKYSAESWNA